MKKTPLHLFLVLLFIIGNVASCKKEGAIQRLSVSQNGHYLIQSDGTPFYWIADTGWAIFQQLTREEIDIYLDDRKEKGFTLIQAVLFWYPHGGNMPNGPLHEENAYGHRPFTGNADHPNTSEPLVLDGGSPEAPNDYWDHADYIVEAARKRGLYLLLLPCWGNAFINNRMEGSRIVFTEDEARKYGIFLGQRYKEEPHIIWCLGGDVDPVRFGDRDQRSVYRAMAEGIGRGISGNNSLKWNESHPDWKKNLMTFHAVRAPYLSGPGAEGGSSSIWFHDDPWLDFNMMETFKWLGKIYPYIRDDYEKLPTKPTVLGEGAYENGSYGNECGWLTPLKVRRQAFHTFFAGGAGFTYGHWAIWPFRGEECGKSWKTALDAPGGKNIGSVFKNFLVEEDIFTWVPAPSVISSKNDRGAMMQCALKKPDGSKILVYFPSRKEATFSKDKLGASPLSYRWFDPRNGKEVTSQANPDHTYLPLPGWEDAVLIIEAKKGRP